jgi:hypothetical protein
MEQVTQMLQLRCNICATWTSNKATSFITLLFKKKLNSQKYITFRNLNNTKLVFTFNIYNTGFMTTNTIMGCHFLRSCLCSQTLYYYKVKQSPLLETFYHLGRPLGHYCFHYWISTLGTKWKNSTQSSLSANF